MISSEHAPESSKIIAGIINRLILFTGVQFFKFILNFHSNPPTNFLKPFDRCKNTETSPAKVNHLLNYEDENEHYLKTYSHIIRTEKTFLTRHPKKNDLPKIGRAIPDVQNY